MHINDKYCIMYIGGLLNQFENEEVAMYNSIWPDEENVKVRVIKVVHNSPNILLVQYMPGGFYTHVTRDRLSKIKVH